jgi:hypothetical protein
MATCLSRRKPCCTLHGIQPLQLKILLLSPWPLTPLIRNSTALSMELSALAENSTAVFMVTCHSSQKFYCPLHGYWWLCLENLVLSSWWAVMLARKYCSLWWPAALGRISTVLCQPTALAKNSMAVFMATFLPMWKLYCCLHSNWPL